MSQTFRRRARRAAFTALACLALPAVVHAAPARASTDQLSLIEDETLMLDSGPATQAAALDEAQALGADVIRANVIWADYAPNAHSTRKPKHFDGKNPDAYPAGVFSALDSFVAGAQARGLQVLLTPTGPVPAWASRCKGSVTTRSTCKPNPQLFGAFVRALGRRYPTVKMWSVWNEPNLRAWLAPQYASVGGHAVLQSAAIYRDLARSAVAGLRATGHRADTILLGETAPIGNELSDAKIVGVSHLNTEPVDFLRGVFCINSRGHRLTGAASAAEHCGHYSRLNVTGYAHHPYTRGGSRPPLSKTDPGEITIGVASRLTRLLDQAAKAGRIAAHLPVYYTENGWQTNPPDQIFGVTLAQQAEYINQSDWIAYKNPRVKMVAQYKLTDDASLGSFQSGLQLNNGAIKPSFAAYELPIWVSGKGSQVTVYGQVRPAVNGTPQQVVVQHAAPGGAMTTIGTADVTSFNGTFEVQAPNLGGVYQLVWNGLASRQAQVAPK